MGHINTATPYPTSDVEGKLCSSGLRRFEVAIEGIWEVGKSTWSGREDQDKSWQMPLLVEMRNRIKEKGKKKTYGKSLSFLPLALESVLLAFVVLLASEELECWPPGK